MGKLPTGSLPIESGIVKIASANRMPNNDFTKIDFNDLLEVISILLRVIISKKQIKIKDFMNIYLTKRNFKIKSMDNFAGFRNRVHIKNYFGYFEKINPRVFIMTRTQAMLIFMVCLVNYFEEKHSKS